MKKLIIVAIPLAISAAGLAQTKAGRIDTAKHSTLYACPERSRTVLTDLNKCPFCGMNLNLSEKAQIKTQVAKAYSCPMAAHSATGKAARKLNISSKEEMKMKVMGFDNSSAHSGVRISQ